MLIRWGVWGLLTPPQSLKSLGLTLEALQSWWGPVSVPALASLVFAWLDARSPLAGPHLFPFLPSFQQRGERNSEEALRASCHSSCYRSCRCNSGHLSVLVE